MTRERERGGVSGNKIDASVFVARERGRKRGGRGGGGGGGGGGPHR